MHQDYAGFRKEEEAAEEPAEEEAEEDFIEHSAYRWSNYTN